MNKVILLLLVLNGMPLASDPAIPPLYHQVARAHGIPVTLFYALILTESRSLIQQGDHKELLPWPWTLHYLGEAHYFPNQEAAHQFAQALVASGELNFDIGLGHMWRQAIIESNAYSD